MELKINIHNNNNNGNNNKNGMTNNNKKIRIISKTILRWYSVQYEWLSLISIHC